MQQIKGFAKPATAADLRSALPTRKAYSDKFSNGMVVVIGGSADYHGAPALAASSAFNALSALRIGAGYAVVLVPRRIADAVRNTTNNLIVEPLGDSNIGEGQLLRAFSRIQKADAVVLGNGIGRSTDAFDGARTIVRYCTQAEKKLVLDAEGIRALDGKINTLGSRVIITPHDDEFLNISGKKPDQKNTAKRLKSASELARKLGCTVLLKGHVTIVTDGKRAKLVKSKSAALATMGTGDVLAGMIGGFAATGCECFEAGVAAAYLHSKIGDTLHKKSGDHIIASDVVDYIPKVLKKTVRGEIA